MFNNVKPKAAALAAFVGYVIPFLLSYWFKVSFLGDIKQPDIEGPTYDYTLTYIFVYGIGPLVGGAIAAHLVPAHPIPNAIFAALIGWLFYALMGTGLIFGIIVILLSCVGASIWQKCRR